MCTGIRFVDSNGKMFMGRNLDWNVGYGQKVVVTPAGYQRTFAYEKAPEKSPAIIGPCIVVDNMPLYFDCANEEGLGIAGLNFPGDGYAQYEEAPIEGKINVAAYEFPLWVASNFTTVDEAEAVLSNVAIVAKPIGGFPISLLHWIIGDATRSIVVEYQADGIHIYRDDVDVLANQPTFPWHMEHLRSYLNLRSDFMGSVKWGNAELTPYGSGGQMVGMPGSFYSPDRFVRVAYLNTHYPVKTDEHDNVIRLFRTLQGVQMIDGGAQMSDGTFEITLYTGGFSAASNTYYMSTYDDPAIQAYPMSDAPADGTELYVFD